MGQELNFTKENNGKSKTQFVTDGPSIVQICREKPGMLLISSSIDDLSPVPIFKFPSDSPKDLIFQLQLPKGMNVAIESESEITNASLLIND